MKRHAAYRVEADLCFWFALLSIFPAMRPWQTPLAMFAAFCLVAALIAVHVPWWPLRLALALLPGLAFLGAELKFLLVFPALGWLYFVIVMTAGRYHVWVDEYRRVFRVMLIIALCAVAANVAHSTIYSGDVISYVSLIYIFAFLCLGVIALRGIQMNAKMGLRWSLANAFTIILAPILAVGGSLLLYLPLRYTEIGLRYVLTPVGQFVNRVISVLFPGSVKEYASTHAPAPSTPPSISIMTSGSEAAAVLEPNEDANMFRPMVVDRATRIGGYVVLAILLVLAIWLVVRIARRGSSKAMIDDYVYEETEEGEAPVKGRKGKKAPVPPRTHQIRQIYKRYLELMRENGIRVQKDSTSQDVLDEAAEISVSPAAARLRELYLKARYADDSSITREEVQEAARCLKEIREDESWKK